MRPEIEELTPIQRAIDEQAKSAFPEPVKDKFGNRVPRVWANKRRRIDTIFNEAVDTNRAEDKRRETSKAKKNRRRRRRGARIYYVRF